MTKELIRLDPDNEHIVKAQEAGYHIPSISTESFEPRGETILGVNYAKLLAGLGEAGITHAVDYKLTTDFIGAKSRIAPERESSLIYVGIGARPLARVQTIDAANTSLWHGTLAAQHFFDHCSRPARAERWAEKTIYIGIGIAVVSTLTGMGISGSSDQLNPDPNIPCLVAAGGGLFVMLKGSVDSYSLKRLEKRSLRKTGKLAAKLSKSNPVLEYIS